jgi:hypothetical protein
MATPRNIVSEQFYHKTSTMRFELGSYRDNTKFKIEIAPQLVQNGAPVEKRFDYDKKISMVFGYAEILRLKRLIENVLNPQKQVPQEGYAIEHFFDVSGEKKKSVLYIKRAENKGAKNQASPYNFAYTAIVTLYSSMKNASVSFGLSEEESYWIINMMPFFAWAFMKENSRILEENRAIKQAGGDPNAGKAATGTPYRAPAPGADFSGEGEQVGDSAFPTGENQFDDIPF